MKYTVLKIETDRAGSEILQAALIEAGFDSMQIDDLLDAKDIEEHPDVYKYDYLGEDIAKKAASEGSLTDGVAITLYFAEDEEGAAKLGEAEELLDRYADVIISCSTEKTGDDSEWLYKWQEYFRPARIGERIVVKPGWEEYEPEEGDLVIEMDPGMAFGSGLHETTSMCIKALEKYTREGAKVLDVGSGTGILAMAAMMLGAENALGIDIDDEAVRVGAENVARNGLEDRVSVRKGDLMAGVDYDADIIVANLMADLVIKLAPAAAAQLKSGGIFITSGILDIKEEAVTEAVSQAGFDIIEVLADGEWRAVVAGRK